MLTKSKAAFLLSCRTLFDLKRRVYLWTFTTRDVVSDEVAFRCWDHLRLLMRREFGDQIPGIRVVEVHPGADGAPGGHGLHFHVLIAKRIPVDVVRHLAIRAGFGRIHVKKARAGHADYLAKYLGKKDDGLRRGTRRWANCFGFKGTLVRNIVVESTLADNCRRVKQVLGTWGYSLFVAVNKLTARYGHCLEWPQFGEITTRVREKSDNDYQAMTGLRKDGRKARFEWIRILDEEINEWVSVLIPATVEEPF